MTYLEKWKKEHPGEDPNWAINTICPADIGINLYVDAECDGKCIDCWDRQIPGTEDKSGLQAAMEKLQAGVIKKATEDVESVTRAIKDSGSRHEFESGAVRDIQEGKGRCDLMPLDVIHDLFATNNMRGNEWFYLGMFTKSGDVDHLFRCLLNFRDSAFNKSIATMLLEVAKHFEEGAKKYGENNWQKGIPVRCYIDSAIRHYLKWLRGDKDEPHDRAFCWNILCAIWTCKHKPELNEYKKEETEE